MTSFPRLSARLAKRLVAAAGIALLGVVTLGAQAAFQEKYEGELFGVRRETPMPGFLGGVAFANGTLYVAEAEFNRLTAYDDDTSAGRTIALQDADGLIPNQLTLVNVDMVDGTTTVPTQALLVSDSSVNRVMAFDLDGNRLFTMRLDWTTNPTSPEEYGDEIPVINGMSMTAGSKFVLTTDGDPDTDDTPSLAVQGTFAAAWAVGFGQRFPGALLVYQNQALDFDANNDYYTAPTPYRELTDGDQTMEAFGVAFDAANRLFLVDTVRFTVTAYDSNLDSTPLFTFGNTGGGETEKFTEPFGIAFWPDTEDPAGGRLFVGDALNNRLVAYRLRADESTLDPLFSIALPQPTLPGEPQGQPYGVAVDPTTGRLAVSDDAAAEDGSTSYRVWVLQTRNLVAYNLETLDVDGNVVSSVCAGEPYQIRFSLTVPRGWPSVAGATPSLTVDGSIITGSGVGAVDLDPLETQAFTYSMVAPANPGDLPVLATATALVPTDTLPLKGVLQIADCSAPAPSVTATPSVPPQVSGVTTLLPIGPNAYHFEVYLDALVGAGDAGGIAQIDYEIIGANETGDDLHSVPNAGLPGEPLPQTQRVVVVLKELGVTTIRYKTRSTAGVWSAPQDYTVNLVGVSNRQNVEGDVVDPFLLPGEDGFTYQVTGLPDGVTVDPNDATGRRIIGSLSYVSSGSHVVTVVESDGATSTSWTFTWFVSEVNRHPEAQPESYTTNEDTPLVVAAPGVLANDADPDQTPLTAIWATPPAFGTLVPSANGSFVYTPAANFNGSDQFVYQASDGIDRSVYTTVTVTVNAVNDPPTFNLGAAPTVAEDAGLQTLGGWATAISPGPADEVSQTVTFLVSNNNTALFAVQPALAADGTLTYQPAPNTSGTATVTVRLQDSGGGTNTSAPQTFTITVSGINDTPSFTKGPDQTVAEDAGLQTVTPWATAISAGAGESQTVSFLVSNDNTALFAVAPAVAADGTLTYRAAANASGTATVTVRVQDNGGTANGGVNTSAPQTFTITVNPVNDPPTFTLGTAPAVFEDAGAQTLAGWTTAISAGPADESMQTVAFTVSNTNAALFVAQPALAIDGTLTFQAAADAFGTATVTVQLSDNGGTLNGGINTSAPQTFTITVTGVNDVPSFTAGASPTVAEDAGAQSLSWATGINAGTGESSQAVSFLLSNDNSGLFTPTGQPTVSPLGTLSYTPAPNAFGTATVTVRIKDNGGVANGGVDTSAPQTFVITVNAVNDAPVAANDAFSVGQDQTLTVAAPGVLAGDSDVDNTPLTASLMAGPSHGTLTLNADGSFVYTPAAGYYGSDSFSYRANDTLTSSATATVTITVVPSNLPPVCTAVASPSIIWPPNHKPVYLTLSGVTDDAGTPVIRFTAILQDEPTNSPGQGNTMQDAGIEANGTKAWVRAERTGEGDGRVYLISYTATDAAGASCTGQVTVSVPHDQSGAPAILSPGRWNSLTGQLLLPPPAPVAAGDTATVAKGDDTVVAVQANDAANGSPLTVTIVSKPSKGSAKVNGNGTITYKAPSNWTGTTTFTYRITDIYGATSTATVTIIVTNSSGGGGGSEDEDDDCGDDSHDHGRDGDNRDRDHRRGDHDRCNHRR